MAIHLINIPQKAHNKISDVILPEASMCTNGALLLMDEDESHLNASACVAPISIKFTTKKQPSAEP